MIWSQSPGPALYQHLGSCHVTLGSCPVQREPALGVWLVRVSSSLEENFDNFEVSVVNCPEQSRLSLLRRRLQLSPQIYQSLII